VIQHLELLEYSGDVDCWEVVVSSPEKTDRRAVGKEDSPV
jgi:hypothetical protein